MSNTAYGLCQCGCGLPTTIAPRTDRTKGWVGGEPIKYRRGHRAPTNRPYRAGTISHVAIATRALGKPLPPGAQVHHVNGNGRDNRNSNLVICENSSYHHLLHVRARDRAAARNQAEQSDAYGLCQCGCGQPTTVAGVNCAPKGWVRGKPMKYVRGHQHRTQSFLKRHTTVPDDYGLCACGCGQKTTVARMSSTEKGWVKGEPIKYVYKHATWAYTKGIAAS